MANGILLKFDGSHHAAVVLPVWKSHPGLTKSQWCHCRSCNGKVPTMFFQAVLVLRHIWAQIFTAQAAAQESKRWDSYHGLKGSWTKEVQSMQVTTCCQFSKATQLSVGRRENALSWALILDLTFHGQWHTSQVRWQPPCSGSFACLIKPSWSCQIALVPLLKLYRHGAKNVLPIPAAHVEHLSADL